MDIEIICNQTNYTTEEAVEKLKLHGNYMSVIREYLNIPTKPIKPEQTYELLHTFMNLKNRPTL